MWLSLFISGVDSNSSLTPSREICPCIVSLMTFMTHPARFRDNHPPSTELLGMDSETTERLEKIGVNLRYLYFICISFAIRLIP